MRLGPMIEAWATVFRPGSVSIAGSYGPPASDFFHKYLNNQPLVPNQGIDSADPDSIPLLLLPRLWRRGGGCERTSPSGIGTRHGVAFPGRGGSGSFSAIPVAGQVLSRSRHSP